MCRVSLQWYLHKRNIILTAGMIKYVGTYMYMYVYDADMYVVSAHCNSVCLEPFAIGWGDKLAATPTLTLHSATIPHVAHAWACLYCIILPC